MEGPSAVCVCVVCLSDPVDREDRMHIIGQSILITLNTVHMLIILVSFLVFINREF